MKARASSLVRVSLFLNSRDHDRAALPCVRPRRGPLPGLVCRFNHLTISQNFVGVKVRNPLMHVSDDDDDAFAVCLHNGLVDGTEGACCTDFAVWDGLLPLRG